MKTNILKHAAIALLLAGCFYSCKDSLEYSGTFFREIPIEDSKTTVINHTVNGIEFKFCLLNEKGVPATRFKQGENFSFYFAMVNHSKEKLNTISDDLESDICSGGFSQVKTLNYDTVCRPFCRYLSLLTIEYHPFYGKDNKREVTIHWNDRQMRQNISWFYENDAYDDDDIDESGRIQLPPLPAGEYYTDFSLRELRLDHKKMCQYIQFDITFKINFKIE